MPYGDSEFLSSFVCLRIIPCFRIVSLVRLMVVLSLCRHAVVLGWFLLVSLVRLRFDMFVKPQNVASDLRA